MLLKTIIKINRIFKSVCRNGLIAIIPAMTIMVFVQVILRYGFNNSLSWVEEMARYLLIWSSCLGAVYASDQGMHVSVDFIYSKLKGKFLLMGVVLTNLLVLIFFLVVTWQGFLYAKMGAIQSSASLGISIAYVYSAIPVSFIMMFSMRIERFAVELKNVNLQGDQA